MRVIKRNKPCPAMKEETLTVDLYYNGKPYKPQSKILLLFTETKNSACPGCDLRNEFVYDTLRNLELYKSVRSQSSRVVTSWYIGDAKPGGRIPWEKVNDNKTPFKNGVLSHDDFPALKKKYIAIDMSPSRMGLNAQFFGVDSDGNNVVHDTLNVAWFYNEELIDPVVTVPLTFKNPGTSTCTPTSEYVANVCDAVSAIWLLNDKYCPNKEYRAQWYSAKSEPSMPIRWCGIKPQPEDEEKTMTLGELCARREGYMALNISPVEDVLLEGTLPNISLSMNQKDFMTMVDQTLVFKNNTGLECINTGEYTADLTRVLDDYADMPYIRWYIADKEPSTPIQWCLIRPEKTKIIAFKDLPSYQKKYIVVDITALDYGRDVEIEQTLTVDLFYKQEPFKLNYTLPLVFKNQTGSPCANTDEYTACLRDAVIDFWKFEYPQEAVRQSLFVRWHMKDTKQPCPIKWRNIMPGRGCAYGEETILLKNLPALKKLYIAVDVSAQPYEVSLQCMMCPKKALLANVRLGETFCSVACYERK